MTTDLTEIPLEDLIAEMDARELRLVSEHDRISADLAKLRGCKLKKPRLSCVTEGDKIVATVAEAFGLTAAAILGRRKNARLVKARHVAMVGLLNAGETIPEVARYFGRDPGCVYHALKNIKQRDIPNHELLP